MTSGRRAAGWGALAAAVGASACCWLPLLLAGLGAGATGAGAQFESLRPYLMAATAVLLAGAFFATYRRREARCGPDGSCTVARSGRGARGALWGIAAVAAVSFAFPYWSAARLERANADAVKKTGPPAFEMPVRGMTCAACGVAIHDAVAAVPGVSAVRVDPEAGKVRIWTDRDIDPAAVAGAIRSAGYEPGAPARAAHLPSDPR